jgi:aminoglycoside 3-N-acetyltransferase
VFERRPDGWREEGGLVLTAAQAEERIADELLAAGLSAGGAVLVHASLSAFGGVPEGPETVIKGLLRALGAGGTLLMPALSYRYVDSNQPVFDVSRTPSCVGAIPEFFRLRLGTRRSVHPTHSVCGVGSEVDRYLGDHQKDDTPCGPHSPYRRLRELGGQVAFLGCGLRPNTSMHGVEEIAEPPYLFGGFVDYTAILPDGRHLDLRCRRHGFPGWSQRYDRVGPLMPDGKIRQAQVLEATVHVLDCSAMWAVALEAMAGDLYCFVEKRPAS